jgi:anti-sigma regulatory factor (Ser/Thr protein kinase)
VTKATAQPGSPYEQSLPAAPESIPRLRHGVSRFAAEIGASDRVRRKIALAVSEACTNAVVHAYRKRGSGNVAVRAERRGRAVCIEVADEGRGMRPRADSPGAGLGTPLMAILADRMEIAENPAGDGTVVRLEFGL